MLKFLFYPRLTALFILVLFCSSKVYAQTYDCTCNLTPNACDTNCCCDSDCTNADKQLFSGCISVYTFENARSCFLSAVTYSGFEPSLVTQTSGDFLCVYFDRYTSRNSFVTPSVDAASSQSVADALAANSGDFDFSPATAEVNATALGTAYTSGSPLEILLDSTDIPAFLPLPASVNSGRCSDSPAAAFLTSEISQCVRSLTDCSATAAGLNSASFTSGFRVAKQPGLFGSSPNLADSNFVNVSSVTTSCQDVNGNSVDCPNSTVPNLSADGTVCQQVLTQLNWSISVSSSGVLDVTADVLLSNVLLSSGLFLQTFGAEFTLSSSSSVTDASIRSGNPGYIIGLPVVTATGSLTGNASLASLALPVADSDGTCSVGSVRLVNFGENSASSCLQKLNFSSGVVNCGLLNSATSQLLQTLGIGGAYKLATFGNVTLNSTEDWVDVNDECGTLSSAVADGNACTGVAVSATLTIKFARVGRLENPQNKIIGAALSCETNAAVYQCYDASCDVSGTQNLLTSFYVNFLDASPALSEGAKQRPVYLARLPSDFFYPL